MIGTESKRDLQDFPLWAFITGYPTACNSGFKSRPFQKAEAVRNAEA